MSPVDRKTDRFIYNTDPSEDESAILGRMKDPGRKTGIEGQCMFLLIGHPQDPCCRSVRAELEFRNHPVRQIINPLLSPARFDWWLDNERSLSVLGWNGEPSVPSDDIEGVLVRNTGWIDPDGWEPDDLVYMQTEVQAALLAWMWSLNCPVINRYPSAIWYHPYIPLLSWHRLLNRSGLPTLETLITNSEEEARSFGQNLASKGIPGAVYGPLTNQTRYIVAGEHEWSGLAAMQRYMPIGLAAPYAQPQSVCVVGERVVWDGEPSGVLKRQEAALCEFAASAGLAFVELAFAPTSEGVCVVSVDPHPHIERFGADARRMIAEGIVHLLFAEEGSRNSPGQPVEEEIT